MPNITQSVSGQLPEWYQNFQKNALTSTWGNMFGGNGQAPTVAAAPTAAVATASASNPMLPEVMNQFNKAQGYVDKAGSYTNYDPTKLNQFLNPYTQNVTNEIARLGNENFQQQLGQLNSNFTGLGQFGSGRQMAMAGQAAAQNQREVLGQQANALNQGYQQAQKGLLDWGQLGANTQLKGADVGIQGAQVMGNLGNQQMQTQANLAIQNANAQNQIAMAQMNAQNQLNLAQMQQPAQNLSAYANFVNAVGPRGTNASEQVTFAEGGLARASKLKKYGEGGEVEPGEAADLIANALPKELLITRPDLVEQAYREQSRIMGDRAKNTEALRALYTEPVERNPWRDIQEMILAGGAKAAETGSSSQGGSALGQAYLKQNQNYDALTRSRRETGLKEEAKVLDQQATDQNALLKDQLANRGRSGGMLPNGNEYIKSGDRAYEVIKDSNSPEGYRLKEIISAGKTILGANEASTLAQKRTAEIYKTLESGGAFEGWSADQINQWSKGTYEGILNHLTGLGGTQPQMTISPSPVVNAAKGESYAPSNSAPLRAEKGTPEASRMLQEELQRQISIRDSSPLNSPARANANATIANLRKEMIATPPATVKPLRDIKQGEGYGTQEGKDLATERKTWGDLYSNAGKLENNLNLLKQLYTSNADIASGNVAPAYKAIKSGLSGLGFKVGDSAGIEDVIQSLATNLSLHARTAEGTNLLPGAMSNYEDQLLQSTQPVLAATKEGRLQMIDLMTEVARSNQRMAQEATKYAQEKGRLDQGWEAVREKASKREMARLAILQRRILSQYGGLK